MNSNPKKAVIFVPFWRQEGHVGNNRVDRFVRWLAEEGYTVVIIRAGSVDSQRHESWGLEITVRDRLGLHRDTVPGSSTPVPTRSPNKLRRLLAYLMFNPDPTVVWARAAARHPAVLQAMDGAAFILSSSPPESAHLGAWMLSRNTGVAHIVDMRDGWLDEPLRPLLRSSTLRRWLEGRIESRILRDANAIQVTSDVWKELLAKRLPDIASKVQVLTNGYPQRMPESQPRVVKGQDEELVLIHAGRFTGSRVTQMPNLLLEPLLANLSIKPSKGVIQLIGSLSADELKLIEPFKLRFGQIGWRIECRQSVSRTEMLKTILQADGLLLLSSSHAAIPSKLFEYIPALLPIFVVTYERSAVWKIATELPQATVVNINQTPSDLENKLFFEVSITNISEENRPNYFSESNLKFIFLNVIRRMNI